MKRTRSVVILLIVVLVTAAASAQTPVFGILSIEGTQKTEEYHLKGSYLWWSWEPSSVDMITVTTNAYIHEYSNYLTYNTNLLTTVNWDLYWRGDWVSGVFTPVRSEYQQVYSPGTTNIVIITNDMPRLGDTPFWQAPAIIGRRVTRSADVRYIETGTLTVTFLNNFHNGPVIYRFMMQNQDGDTWPWYVRVEHGQRVVQVFDVPGAARDSGRIVDWFRMIHWDFTREFRITKNIETKGLK